MLRSLAFSLSIFSLSLSIDNILSYRSNAFCVSPILASAAALLVNPLILFGSIFNNLSKYVIDSFDLSSAIKTDPLFSNIGTLFG